MNVWQYVVLLEGLGAVATSLGLAHESLRREPLRLVGYANLGVALISLSVCASLLSSLRNPPTSGTWIAAAGFAIYGIAAVGSWLHALARLSRFTRDHLDHHFHAGR